MFKRGGKVWGIGAAMGEVFDAELPMQLAREFIAGMSRLYGRGKCFGVMGFVADGNATAEPARRLTAHAEITVHWGLAEHAVEIVLLGCCGTEVIPAAVQTVAVPMVNLFPCDGINDGAVKKNRVASSVIPAYRAPGIDQIAARHRGPLVSRHAVVVLWRYQGDVTASE
jgi:hypothetical protein